jgi:serine/threonine protein kinase
MAPEVINGEENTKALDWWSFGVIAYEFMTGSLPFQADTPFEVFNRIKNRDIKYPPIGREENQMSPEAHSLIEGLLSMNPKTRLTIEEIK